MRQLTHIPTSNRATAEIGYTRPAAKPLDESKLDGAFQPCAPAALVRIVELEKEWTTYKWLCPAAVKLLVETQRWTVRGNRAPPFDDLPCAVHVDGPCPRV